MSSFRFPSLFALSCALLAFASPAFASSLEELEAVAAKAPNVRAFLNDPKLVDEYYQAAAAYYGEEKFSRNSYDVILKQLRELDQKVPALGDRIWETTNLGKSFEISMPIPISGLQLKSEAWDSFIGSKMAELHKSAAPVSAMPAKERSAHIRRVFEAKQKEIEAFEKDVLPKTSKAERGLVTQEFYRTAIRENPDLAAIAAHLVAEKIEQDPLTQKMLQTKSADGILFAWEEMRKPKGLALKGSHVPDRLHRFLVDMALPALTVPKLEMTNGKPAESELFRVVTKTSREGKPVPLGSAKPESVEFKAIPRRFHGIFKGVRLGECVGGNCYSLGSLTPERWATSALKDSRVYHVDKGSSHHGFVQLVPVQVDGKTYASLEFGSPFLTQNGFVLDPKTKRPVEAAFTGAMLERLKTDLPEGWAGLVVSGGDAINNAGVLKDFRNTSPYQKGTVVGAAANVKHLDPLAAEIISHSPRGSHLIEAYAGNMIIDATSNRGQSLRALNLSGNLARDSDKLVREALKNPKKLLAAIKNGTADFRRQALQLTDAKSVSDASFRELFRLATEQNVKIPLGFLGFDPQRAPQMDPELTNYLFSQRNDPYLREFGHDFEEWRPKLSPAQKETLLTELGADRTLAPKLGQLTVYRNAVLESPEAFLRLIQDPPPYDELRNLMVDYFRRRDPAQPDLVANWIVRNPTHPAANHFEASMGAVQWGPRWWAEIFKGLLDGKPHETILLATSALKHPFLPAATAQEFLAKAETRYGTAALQSLYQRLLREAHLPLAIRNWSAEKALPVISISSMEAEKNSWTLQKNLHAYLMDPSDSPAKEAAFNALMAKGQEGDAVLRRIFREENRLVGPHKYVARWVAETSYPDYSRVMAWSSFNLYDLEKNDPALYRKVSERVHASLMQALEKGQVLDSQLLPFTKSLPKDLHTTFLDQLLKNVENGTFRGPYDPVFLRGTPFRAERAKGYARFLAQIPDPQDHSRRIEAQKFLREELARQPAMEKYAREQLKAYQEGKTSLTDLRAALTALRGRTQPPLPADLSAAYLAHVDLLDPWIDEAVRFVKKNPSRAHVLGTAKLIEETYVARTIRELDASNWPATEKKIKIANWFQSDVVVREALKDPALPRDLRAILLAYSGNPRGYATREQKRMAKELAEMLVAGRPEGYAEDIAKLPWVEDFIRSNENGFLRHVRQPVIGRLKTCGDIYAELVRGWGPAGMAFGGAVALTPIVGMGIGAYHLVDKSRDRLYACGKEDSNKIRLVKKSGKWFCEDGRAYSCDRGYDPEGYTDLSWSGSILAGKTSKQPKGVRAFPYFNHAQRGLDGHEYGYCRGEENRVTCLTCQGSTPERPVYAKVVQDGEATFAVAPDGSRKLILLNPKWGELYMARRASDGKFVHESDYLENGTYKSRQTPLENLFPRWKNEIRALEQEQK